MRSNGIQRPRRQFVRDLVLIAGAAPFLSASAATQKSARVPRIGYLGGDFSVHRDAFMNELRAQGFVDGENVIIEKRLQRDLANGPAAAKELAALPLDFIVASALPYALMVRAANPNMPMVITTCPGMISNGFARSFEHPGGIYTGIDELPPGVTTKRHDVAQDRRAGGQADRAAVDHARGRRSRDAARRMRNSRTIPRGDRPALSRHHAR